MALDSGTSSSPPEDGALDHSMVENLEGRKALVTGAAKRVGRAICLALGDQGVDILIAYRRSAKDAEATSQALRSKGVRALALQADLAESSGCRRLVSDAEREFGCIDILVNNASDFGRTPIRELVQDVEEFQNRFDYFAHLHMAAPLYLGIRLGLRMKERGWGRIVNLTDRVTVRGQAYPDWALYLATKYGLYGTTQILARELAPEVTVNSVAPGLVVPPPDFDSEEVERIRRRIPLQRQSSAEEIAADVLHLIRSASKTGSAILTDGGVGLIGG